MEAMALRLAIAASDIPAVAETVGDVGWPLVRPDDGESLAQALISVIERGALNDAAKDAGQSVSTSITPRTLLASQWLPSTREYCTALDAAYDCTGVSSGSDALSTVPRSTHATPAAEP